MKRAWLIGAVILMTMMVAGARWLWPERSLSYTGLRALLDAGFALVLLGAVLLLAGGVGQKVLRWLELDGCTRLERTLFEVTIGLGILAYGTLALGMVGLLYPWAILLWMVIASVWSWQAWSETLANLPGYLKQLPSSWRKFRSGERLVVILGSAILALTLIQSLTPPSEFDALMYHLRAPREFLKVGRIVPLPDIWQANGPFTAEMLYTLGLAFGSDTFAKLTHFLFAVGLVLSTFALGQRNLKSVGGWIAAAILLGIPIFPIWASMAYADMAWALFQFLGLYALSIWTPGGRRAWLVLAGLMAGLALGSKYLALGYVSVLGLWVLWRSRTLGWKIALAHVVLFGAPAVLVGLPWYLKNWLWVGNPVYPLFFGGTGWSADQVNWLTAYHASFGMGHSWLDYLFLPWNLYAHHDRFGTLYGSIEIPSLLFPAALFYPWTPRSKVMDGIAGVTALWFIVWALGVQQVRHLLPLFPNLCLLATTAFMHLLARPSLQRWGRTLVAGLVGGMVVTTLVYSLIFFAGFRPLAVVWGIESKDSFLRRIVNDYAALQFAQANLAHSDRVFMMWDARGYYCDERCLPDGEHYRWTRLVKASPDVSTVATRLREMGVTHLLFTLEDTDFILQHDPDGSHYRAAVFFMQEFRASCTREIYRDQWAFLFEITCP